jgi:hypothetical protein
MSKYETTMEEIADLYLRCAYSTTQEEILKAFHEVVNNVCAESLMGKLLLVALFLNPHLTQVCIRTMKDKDNDGILSLNPALPLLLVQDPSESLANVAEKKARVPDFSYMTVHEGHRPDFLAMDSLTKEELMAAALYAWARHGYSDALQACLKHMGPCRELDDLKFGVECNKARGCLHDVRHDEKVDFFSLDPRACAQEIRGIIRAHQCSKQKRFMQTFSGVAQHPYDEFNDVNLHGLRCVLYGYREHVDDRALNAAICDAYLYLLAQEPSVWSLGEPYFPEGLKRCLLETNCKARLALELAETTDPEAFQRISGELAKLNGI